MKLSIKRDLDLYVGQVLIWIMIPFTRLLGFILGRNHETNIKGDVLFIKMAGGGSLVIAYPALKEIKENIDGKMVLLTSRGVEGFAKTLDIFDEIIILKDQGLFSFALSYLGFFIRKFKAFDTVINLEVHSRLATLISLFTLARNRVGFHRHEFTPFTNLNTHSCYFNVNHGIYKSYDGLLELFGYKLQAPDAYQKTFKENIETKFPIAEDYDESYYSIGIGAVCSDLALERMMPIDFWRDFASERIRDINKPIRIFLYGAPGDKAYYEGLTHMAFNDLNAEVINAAGFKPLGQTINHMNQILDEYWGIDTSLLHYSRILNIKSHLFWGPTNPKSYLREFPELTENIYFKAIKCSPCVHLSRKPPCKGKNICMHHEFSA